MGKRSNFERRERDFYPTPPAAVRPLLPHLTPPCRFVEPCAGDGALVRALEAEGHVCAEAFDIEPRNPRVLFGDALREGPCDNTVWALITNPPWRFDFVRNLVALYAPQTPVWLLLSADFAHNKQSASLLDRFCHKIVSVGRVKWIPDSPHAGKDNAAWYLFAPDKHGAPRFYPRRD